MYPSVILFFFFFFNDTATTEIYTLSLHDALPIFPVTIGFYAIPELIEMATLLTTLFYLTTSRERWPLSVALRDRKSTRLNSSHVRISYAVFCLKKKTNTAGTLASSLHHRAKQDVH